ncbi:MAG: hypothetical protein Q7S87_04395 [Agitococcus sp.]|nr:hypothetical protein [Agitococcus sp.]
MKRVVIEGKSQHGFERDCKFDGDCFVAGTLVHTDMGLVPIDKLKVGDLVLSRPENDPDAPNEYKRVLSTFNSAEKKRITYFSYDVIEEGAGTGNRYLFCTEEHAFWTMVYEGEEDVHALGWQPAQALAMLECHVIKTYHNKISIITSEQGWENVIYEEDSSKIVFLYGHSDDPRGMYDFRRGQPVCIGGNTYECLHPSEAKSAYDMEMLPEMLELVERRKSDIFYDYVYNIEVEEFHTYFVSEAGIWVHNTASKRSP